MDQETKVAATKMSIASIMALTSKMTLNEWVALAYADPETGSDRYFLEAMRMKEMDLPGWEAVRDQGIARYLEIQAENPYPET